MWCAVTWLLVGSFLGVLVTALMTVSARSDSEMERLTKMDDADISQERAEKEAPHLLAASRKPEGPIATGRCLWCDEVVGDNVRWCPGEDCRDLWEKQRRFKR